MRRRETRARWGRRTLPALLALACAVAVAPLSPTQALRDEPTSLYLVTFDRPGTAGHGGEEKARAYRSSLRDQQDEALATVTSDGPVYRWTTALSGVAVRLSEGQATDLQAQPGVVTVEENAVRPLAAAPAASSAAASRPRGRGGAGVVIGVVDTGIWPESPLFADTPALGRRPTRFGAACAPGEDWERGTCNAKLVAGRWFADGFGRTEVAADEPLSPRDVRGHGTQVASIAAGNSGVSIGERGLPRSYSGVAPRARVAAYKACWSAPDPDDDGCATADLVAAIDAATRDGVDVLNLSVAGGADIDTVERALLGAAEAGIVVMAAAGSTEDGGYATHVSPWVTTVGALTSRDHTGVVSLGSRRLTGVMTARREVRARAVAARTIPAPGHSVADAARCLPGSLDVARASRRIVVCERGAIGRVAKSAAVARAHAEGMVLVNVNRGGPTHDLHQVPSIHLGRQAGERLLEWLDQNPRRAVALAPGRDGRGRQRVAPWSPAGDPHGTTLKPDLVSDGTGLLAGQPPTVTGDRWTFLSGTSAATARASGAAATLLARHDWSAPVLRSLLSGSARPGRDSVLSAGSGRERPAAAARGRLAHDVAPGDYRAWLNGGLSEVNTPSVLSPGAGTATRELTNVGGRTDTWRVEVSGFERHDVTVTPASLTLTPGRSATYRVTVGGGSVGGLDEGHVTWVGSDGTRTRVPVAIGR